MQFVIKRDSLLKSLTLAQGIIEKKNTLPILSNVLLEAKNGKLSIMATDLDLVFYDETSEIKIEKDKVYCGSGVIVDNCEKCGSGQHEHLYCSGDCKWSNGKCVLRGKFLLILSIFLLAFDVVTDSITAKLYIQQKFLFQ